MKPKLPGRNPGERHNSEPSRISWHPAFLQAIQMELANYRDVLEFKYEYQLTAEPLRIDLLVVKKSKDVIIDKNIARIFRSDNVIEFKSPDKSVSIRDFLKVYSYACLYAAITKNVELSDMTITFIGRRHPRKLLKYFTNERRYKVEEKQAGIYFITGDYIPIQIIESRKLEERENLWLKSLAGDLEIRTMSTILESSKQALHDMFSGAYFDVLLRANPQTFLEVYKMKSATFEEVFTKAGIIPQWIEKGIKKGIEQEKKRVVKTLVAKGMSPEEIGQVVEIPVEKVSVLAK